MGGNDCSLAKSLAAENNKVTVIDPLAPPNHDILKDANITTISEFVENIVIGKDTIKPDLVVSRHCLEHISDPLAVISNWLKYSSTDAYYVEFQHLNF